MVKRIALWISLLVFSQMLFAQTDNGAFNIPAPFENAAVIYEDRITTRNYILALGPYEKIGNLWQPEKKQRLAGDLLRQTHKIPKDYSEQDIYDYYIAALGDNNEVLYRCESFNCGDSNNWANVHFGIKQLYGLDRNQFYRVVRLESGIYATIYIVRRGNRRIYAQIEMIKAEE